MNGRWLRVLLIWGMLGAMIPLSIINRLETVVHAASGGGWALTGNMKEIRTYHTMTMLTSGVNAGKVLVAGGSATNSPPPDHPTRRTV